MAKQFFLWSDERRKAQIQKEKKELEELRKETDERIALANRKEKHLEKLEAQFAVKEKRFYEQEGRTKLLREEQEKLSGEITHLGSALSQKSATAEQVQRLLLNSQRELAAINAKRADLRKHEQFADVLGKKEKELAQEVARKEKRVQEGAKLIQSQQKELEQTKTRLAQLNRQIELASKIASGLKNQIPSEKRELEYLIRQKKHLERQKIEQEQRERILNEQEKTISQRIKELDRKRFNASEAHQKEQAIALLVEEKKRVLTELRKSISNNAQLLENLKNQEAKVRAATQSFLITQEEQRSKTIQQEKALAERRELAEEKISQLSHAEQAFDKKLRAMSPLRAEVESLERRKQEALAVLAEKKTVLDSVRKGILEQQKTLQQLKDEEEEARQAAAKLIKTQHNFNQRLNLVEQKEKTFSLKETELEKREKNIERKETVLQEATRLLAQDKDKLVENIKAREDAFLAVRNEWNERVEQLKREKEDLKNEKASVRKLIESDVAELRAKEDELLATVSELEADKKKLEEEERALIMKIKEFEKVRTLFEKEKASLQSLRQNIADNERLVQKSMKFVEIEKRKLEREQDQIYRAKEIKKMLPSLERRYTELQKGVRSFQTGAIEKAIAVTKRKAFNEKQVEHEKHTRPEDPNLNIREKINRAKEHLARGELDDAVRLTAEAEYLAEKVKDSEQRRLLIYDVRDVKASIKLAMLS